MTVFPSPFAKPTSRARAYPAGFVAERQVVHGVLDPHVLSRGRAHDPRRDFGIVGGKVARRSPRDTLLLLRVALLSEVSRQDAEALVAAGDSDHGCKLPALLDLSDRFDEVGEDVVEFCGVW